MGGGSSNLKVGRIKRLDAKRTHQDRLIGSQRIARMACFQAYKERGKAGVCGRVKKGGGLET